MRQIGKIDVPQEAFFIGFKSKQIIMYESILIISVIIISILFAAWVYSEKKLDGKFSKTISTVSFPFPLLALYAVFKLNISFGYILVGLTLVSLVIWIISRRTDLVNLQKEARSFFLILLGITIFRSFIYELSKFLQSL